MLHIASQYTVVFNQNKSVYVKQYSPKNDLGLACQSNTIHDQKRFMSILVKSKSTQITCLASLVIKSIEAQKPQVKSNPIKSK